MKTRILLFVSAIALLISVFTANAEDEWTQYTYGGQEVAALANEGEYIWIGTTGGLVKMNKSTGDKVFYNNANSGLPDNLVFSIAIDGEGNKWFGTWDGGVAMLKEGATSVRESKYKNEGALRAYPNPFSQSTTINYQLTISDNVVLKIYDMFGSEVRTLGDEFQDAGEHSAVFEVGNLSCGIYYYTIRIGGRTESGKMALVR